MTVCKYNHNIKKDGICWHATDLLKLCHYAFKLKLHLNLCKKPICSEIWEL